MPVTDLGDQLNQLRKKKRVSTSPNTKIHELTINNLAIPLLSRAAKKTDQRCTGERSPGNHQNKDYILIEKHNTQERKHLYMILMKYQDH